MFSARGADGVGPRSARMHGTTWTGHGVGTLKKDGSISYRGACYYQSASPAWARFNGIAGVFEYEVDAQGHTRGQLWEWK